MAVITAVEKYESVAVIVRVVIRVVVPVRVAAGGVLVTRYALAFGLSFRAIEAKDYGEIIFQSQCVPESRIDNDSFWLQA